MKSLNRGESNTTWVKTHLIKRLNGDAREFTIGHTNPFGVIKFDDSRAFDVEQGPKSGGEIDLLARKSDYG